MKHRIVWLYGLAGAGKSTLAAELHRRYGAVVVDSDVFKAAWPTLGWSEEAKKERAARLLRVALAAPGRVVVACITPFAESRKAAQRAGALVVQVVTPPEECARRKPEIYERAQDLAGKDAPFEDSAGVELPGDNDVTLTAADVAILAGWV